MSKEDERRKALEQLQQIPGIREKLRLGKKPQEANDGAEAYTMPSSVEAPSAVESTPSTTNKAICVRYRGTVGQVPVARSDGP